MTMDGAGLAHHKAVHKCAFIWKEVQAFHALHPESAQDTRPTCQDLPRFC